MPELIVLAIADPEFLPRLEVLAASLERNSPSARLHACLVNVEPADAERLRVIHRHTELQNESLSLDATHVKIGLDGITPYTEKAGYCVNLRGRVILDLLHAGCRRVLFVDADTIVRRDLGPLCALIDQNDLVIHKRPEAPEFMRVAGGVIGVRPTDAAIEFFTRAVARIDAIGNREFFSDQLAFHLTIEELDGRVSVGHLPKKFIDWDFDEQSFIWVGKGRRKHENAQYLAEERSYV
jgi:Nucleotide-diphospho-sugar transferase